jgi:anti-anti-sigma factor
VTAGPVETKVAPLIADVISDAFPVHWTGKQAVVSLPEHIDASNAGQVREQLLGLINRGAAAVIADMTATASCDHGGAEALLRAYQRASVNGARLRVVVTAQIVRRVLDIGGLDRLISIYPTVEAAVAAGEPGTIPPAAARDQDQASARHPARALWRRGAARSAAAITPAVLWALIDVLADGIVLTDAAGVLVAANRRAEEMFGYRPGELAGRPVESLIPVDLRASHLTWREGYAREPAIRPMGTRARLVGLGQDGGTFPARVSLSPVPTAAGGLIMAVIRDITENQPTADLADLARVAASAAQARRGQDLLDQVEEGLSRVGASLHAATGLPRDQAVERFAAALGRLDDTIAEIRRYVFGA